jgi:hypothetical protein
MPSELLNQFQDASGKVTVAVFRLKSGSDQQHYHDFACEVPSDMVAIGGGAEGARLPHGALLTASYPNGDLSAWLASSKDHEVAQPHKLTCYAIGLKIAGMTRNQILDNIHVEVQDSGVGNHPEAAATVPGQHVLVSGGFKVEWAGAGNLGTASFPETNSSWKARSKEHNIADPANIKAYAISIKEKLPVGIVRVDINEQESAQAQHPSVLADVDPGFALTGAGARVNWQGAGNLLWMIRPTTSTANQDVSAASKDHNVMSPATIVAYSLAIKIV